MAPIPTGRHVTRWGVIPANTDIHLAHLPRLVFSDAVELEVTYYQRYEWGCLAPNAIYHLFDMNGGIIYVGMSQNVEKRLSSHISHWIWREVGYLNLYNIDCRDHRTEPCSKLRPIIRYWEDKAIKDLQPHYNAAGIPGRHARLGCIRWPSDTTEPASMIGGTAG